MTSRWLSTFESDLPRLVGDLEALVRLESPSGDAARVSRLAAWVHDTLRERGVPAELRPCPSRGDALLASVVFREGGTLLLGHLDTVWPVGTLAEMPWRLDGGRAHGPGVFDMKAGIVVGMAVLTAMVRESRPHPVSLLLVPDEEVGSASLPRADPERGAPPPPGARPRAVAGRGRQGGAEGLRHLRDPLPRPRRARGPGAGEGRLGPRRDGAVRPLPGERSPSRPGARRSPRAWPGPAARRTSSPKRRSWPWTPGPGRARRRSA